MYVIGGWGSTDQSGTTTWSRVSANRNPRCSHCMTRKAKMRLVGVVLGCLVVVGLYTFGHAKKGPLVTDIVSSEIE